MFDISLFEFFLAAVVALLVLGPNRLPGALRTLGLWVGRLRRSYYNVKSEIEREIGMDDVRRQLHNEQVMADVRRVEREVRGLGTDAVGVEAETSTAESEAPAPQVQATPGAAPTAAPAAAAIEQKVPAETPAPTESRLAPVGASEPDAAAGPGRAAAGTDAPRHSGE